MDFQEKQTAADILSQEIAINKEPGITSQVNDENVDFQEKQTAADILSQEIAIKKEPGITSQVNDENVERDETSGSDEHRGITKRQSYRDDIEVTSEIS